MPMESRFKTFSPVFDRILGGGFPRPCFCLFEDSPLGLSWDLAVRILYDGLKEGEVGICVTFDHSPDLYRSLLKSVEIDTGKYEKTGKFFIINGSRLAAEDKDYTIRDPSNEGELSNVFATLRDSVSGGMSNRCRCVVDSSISLYFVYGIEKLVKFALLLREISIKLGITTIFLSPVSIGRRVNHLLGYNSDVVVEFKVVEEGEQLINKMRVRKMFGQAPSSPWVTYTATAANLSIQDD
jgi:KaiC/GvpD/RAD55 family RecA-like ATPase